MMEPHTAPRRTTGRRIDRRGFVAGATVSMALAAVPSRAQAETGPPGVGGARRAADILRAMGGRGDGPVEVWFLPGCRWATALAFAVVSHEVTGIRWVPGGRDAGAIRRCLDADGEIAFLAAVADGSDGGGGHHPNVEASGRFEVEAWRTVGRTPGSPTLVYPARGEWRMVRGAPGMDDLRTLVAAARGS